MVKFVDIVPQEVSVSAPLDQIFGLLSNVEYAAAPASGRTVGVLSRDEGRAVVAFTTTDLLNGQTTIVKEILITPPDRLAYNHQSGPHAGAREEITLRSFGDRTRITISACFPVAGTGDHRVLKLAFEHAAHAHLRDIKIAAEKRPHHPEHEDVATPALASVPAMSTEQQLYNAVEWQEEAEWGHAGHGKGVSRVALALAESIFLSKENIDMLMQAALLHDVGKTGISSTFWGARGVLSAEQREVMFAHPRLGANLCANAGLPEPVSTSILHHHERWDGTGYPERLRGEATPLLARILAVAESLDTMMRISYRREPLRQDKILTLLEEGALHKWDPMLSREAMRIIRGK
jgi:putative nucleotidyltransferase with HDIG domain